MKNEKTTAYDWIKIAESDLSSAKKLIRPPDRMLKTAAYHCQQCAEKSVKALFVINEEDPPKIHDIADLIKKFQKISGNLNDLMIQAEELTDLATSYRYPSRTVEPLTVDSVRNSIKDSEKFLSRAKEIIDNKIKANALARSIKSILPSKDQKLLLNASKPEKKL